MHADGNDGARSEEGKGRSTKFRVGVLLAVLVALIASGAAVVSTYATGWPYRGHGIRGHFGHHPELARERAEFAASWVLSRVDATEEQQEEVRTIIGRSVDELTTLAAQHHEKREAWLAELSRPTIDRAALEQLRREGIETADAATARIVEALADAAEVLTPEQRAQLIQMADRFHDR